MKKKLLALICILAMSVGILAACGGGDEKDKEVDSTGEAETQEQSTDGDTDTEGTDDSAYKEAPELAELVASGALPSVEERLPVAEDIMVEVKDSVGSYGEAFNFTHGGKGSQ